MRHGQQADLERAAGLPVSVMLAPDDVALATNEVGFISAVVAPLYRTLVSAAPPLRACLTLIDQNKRMWEQVAARGAAGGAEGGGA